MRFLEIRRGNKNTLGEISVLASAMVKKPFYHYIISYFSSPKVIIEPTYGELMTEQAYSWGKAFI